MPYNNPWSVAALGHGQGGSCWQLVTPWRKRGGGFISACMYLFLMFLLHLFLKFPSVLGVRVLARFGASWLASLENTAPADVSDIELSPEPQMARNGRSSLARTSSWLEMAARAWPGAAAGSKWPLEPGTAPQLARDGRSRVPWSRRMLDGCRSNLLRNREMLAW